MISLLSDEGYSNKEISYYFNKMGILSDKGKEYYPNLVWSIKFKWKKRLDRINSNPIVEVDEVYGWINKK